MELYRKEYVPEDSDEACWEKMQPRCGGLVHRAQFIRTPASERLVELGRKVWEAAKAFQQEARMPASDLIAAFGRGLLAVGAVNYAEAHLCRALAAALAEMEAQNAVSSH